MSSFKVAVFDLDGTILDTLEDLADSLNEALTRFRYPEASLQEVRARVGNGLRKLVERSVPEECPEQEIERIRECLAEVYQRRCCEKTKPYPGIPEAFRRLHEEGVKVAVVSNKIDSAVRMLCETYFPGQIDYCAGEQVGVRKKPCPDMVDNALEALQAGKENTVYVGDSEVDIVTSKNAGLKSIIVTWGFRDKPHLQKAGAEQTADTVQEMLDEILHPAAACTIKPEVSPASKGEG